MYPQTHFLFSFLVGLIFFKTGVIDLRMALLVAVVGLLVDLDHYITFIIKYKAKDFKIKDAWNRAVKGMYRGRSFIHHTIGIVWITVILILLFFGNRYWFWIFSLGYYSHLFMDYAHLNFLRIREKMTIKKFGFKEKIEKFEVLLDIFLLIIVVILLVV